MGDRIYKFIDLFAGIGGFRLGFEKAGFQCVFSSEINTSCQQVYSQNFGEFPRGDINKIDINSIPDFDILTAGFPCQPFSICGKRKGFEDTRGTLFFRICEIISIKKPSVIVLENVKFLLHHDQGKTLETILYSLADLGYFCSYNLLNAKDFGLPQNRERVVIVASLNRKFNLNLIKKIYPTPKLQDFLSKDDNFEYLSPDEYTLIDNPKQQESGLIFVGYRTNKSIWKQGVKPNTEHLSRVHRQPNRIYSVLGVHPTLPSQETSGRFFIYLPNENAVRKLTIKECYRIMGFPENFKLHNNLSECYKQIGNSVSIPMIYNLAISLKEQLLENNTSIDTISFNKSKTTQPKQLQIPGLL